MSLKPLIIAALAGHLAAPALAEGDPANGEKVYRKCKSCHEVGDDAKNKVGPILNGIINTAAAANPDFKYSPAMIEAAEAGLVWDAQNLTEYLAKPKDKVPGTKMTFAGLRKDSDIEDVIAYLMQYSTEMEEEGAEGAETTTTN